MQMKENSLLLMQGDSITDCGRLQPTGEGWAGLGDGYALYTAAMLDAMYPQRHIRVVNMGISGNTSRDLLARWQTDTLAHAPTWVSVMIGANDVWRQFDSPDKASDYVLLPEYADNLSRIVAQTLPQVEGMRILGPFYMGQCADEPMRALMQQYAEAARQVAQQHEVPFIDTQAAMDKYFRHYHYTAMSWDAIHPNPPGHMLLARCLLESLGAF